MKSWIDEHLNLPASNNSAIKLTMADLRPAQGLSEQYDDAVFALCDIDACLQIKAAMPAIERFCHQLRRAVDADTVYLCERQSLRILATTSSGTVIDQDTQTIHTALTEMVSDLENCTTALQLPDIRVFPEQEKMSFAAIPVGQNVPGRSPDLIAILVDADSSIRDFNQYYADAVQALFLCHTGESCDPDTNPGFELVSPPTTKQLQSFVFDELNRRYWNNSERIIERRYEMFCEDLRHVTVQFEKILELANSGQAGVWGWEVVASIGDTGQFPKALFLVAEEWGEEFRTALDLHLLKEAAFRYKSVCEAENLVRFEDIKPLCISVYPQSLQQPDYITTLRDLTEKVITHGSRLVFEISEKISLSNDSVVERQAELNDFAAQLKALRSEFNIRIALDEFGAGNSSLSRFICLEPDIIKLDRSVLSGDGSKVLELLETFWELTGKRHEASLEVILEGEEVTGEDPLIDDNNVGTRKKFHSSLDEATATV